MRLSSAVLWSHTSLAALVLDAVWAGSTSAVELCGVLGCTPALAPFQLSELARGVPLHSVEWLPLLALTEARGLRERWLAALVDGGASGVDLEVPSTAALQEACRAEVGDQPLHDPDALALFAHPGSLPHSRERRARALLTLAGWWTQTASDRRPPPGVEVPSEDWMVPLALRSDRPPLQLEPPLPPPSLWQVGLPGAAVTSHLSAGPLTTEETLNVHLVAEDGQQGWIVVLLEYQAHSWSLAFPQQADDCVPWELLRPGPDGARILGINTGPTPGRKRWAVGLVPRALLDRTVFVGEVEGLRAAVDAGVVQLQSFRHDVVAAEYQIPEEIEMDEGRGRGRSRD